MSDRFPYNLPSREALCVEIRKLARYVRIEDRYVTFEDMVFSPTVNVPGRTYLEMVDLKTSIKSWFVYRRLDLSIALGPDIYIYIVGKVSPKTIAQEINRSRGMVFGADDISFSDEELVPVSNIVEYRLEAMMGSYAYYGHCNVTVEVIPPSGTIPRLEEDGTVRLLENGFIRTFE